VSPAARKAVPASPPDPEEVMLAAVRRWRMAAEAYEEAKAAHELARRELVASLHELGVMGFSL